MTFYESLAHLLLGCGLLVLDDLDHLGVRATHLVQLRAERPSLRLERSLVAGLELGVLSEEGAQRAVALRKLEGGGRERVSG